jgi:hypothetical protein
MKSVFTLNSKKIESYAFDRVKKMREVLRFNKWFVTVGLWFSLRNRPLGHSEITKPSLQDKNFRREIPPQ